MGSQRVGHDGVTSLSYCKVDVKKKKKTYLCFIDYTKAFDCVDHNKLWKILQEMGIPAA